MKKTTTPLKKQLIRTLLVSLLCGFSLPALAQADNDGDNPPDITPPIRRIAAAVEQQTASVDVIFLEASDNTQVEVCDEQGKVVYTAYGTVAANERLRINAAKWKKGRYTVRISSRGKPSGATSLLLR